METGTNDAMESSVYLFPMFARGSNCLFQELVGRTDSLQLLEAPFEQYGPEVGQCPFLPGGVLLKLGTNFLTDPDADLNSPFSHFLPSYLALEHSVPHGFESPDHLLECPI
jgi:hypothetical protein